MNNLDFKDEKEQYEHIGRYIVSFEYILNELRMYIVSLIQSEPEWHPFNKIYKDIFENTKDFTAYKLVNLYKVFLGNVVNFTKNEDEKRYIFKIYSLLEIKLKYFIRVRNIISHSSYNIIAYPSGGEKVFKEMPIKVLGREKKYPKTKKEFVELINDMDEVFRCFHVLNIIVKNSSFSLRESFSVKGSKIIRLIKVSGL